MAWAPNYITLDEFKNYLRIPLTDTEDDVELNLAIAAASRAVDKCCSQRPNGLGFRRQFGLATGLEPRYYTPRWDNDLIGWVIEIDDLMDITGLVVQVDTSNLANYNQTITSYVLRPEDAPARNLPYTQIRVLSSSAVQPTFYQNSAKVTLRPGWTTTPDTVKLATKLQANRFNKRRTAPFGVAGSPAKGNEQKILENLDPDLETMLSAEGLIRIGWTV